MIGYVKRPLRWIVYCALLIALSLLGARQFVHSARGQQAVQQLIFGSRAQIGSLRFSGLLPNRVEIRQARWTANLSGTSAELRAESLKLRISLLTLLKGELRMQLKIPQLLCALAPSDPAGRQSPAFALPSNGIGLPLREVNLTELTVEDLQVTRWGETKQARVLGSAHLSLTAPRLRAKATLTQVPVPTHFPLPPCAILADVDAKRADLRGRFDPIWLLDKPVRVLDTLPLQARVLVPTPKLRAFALETQKSLDFELNAQWVADYPPGTKVLRVVELEKYLPLQLSAQGQILSNEQIDIAFEHLRVESTAGIAAGSGKIEGGQWRDCALEMEVGKPINLPKPLRSIPPSRGVLRWSGALATPSFSYALLPGGRTPKEWMSQWKLQVDALQRDPTKWVFDLFKEGAAPAVDETSAAELSSKLRRVAAGKIALDPSADGWQLNLDAQGILPPCTPVENTTIGGFFLLQSRLEISRLEGDERCANASLRVEIADCRCAGAKLREPRLQIAGEIPLNFDSALKLSELLIEGEGQCDFAASSVELPGKLEARQLLASADQRGEKGRFALAAESLELKTRTPCPVRDLKFEGDWECRGQTSWACTLQKLRAQIQDHALSCKEPLQVVKRGDALHLPDLHLQLGEGALWGQLALDKGQLRVRCNARELPLALVNPLLETDFSGQIGGSLRGLIDQKHLNLQLRARTKSAELGLRGTREPLDAELALDVRDKRARARLLSSFLEGPLSLEGQLPLQMCQRAPFCKLARDQPLQWALAMRGELAPLAALALPQGQFAGGRAEVNLRGGGTLQSPTWSGSGQLSGGEYTHEASRVHLVQIAGECNARDQLFSWDNLTGRDRRGGEFQSHGRGHLWPTLALQADVCLKGVHCAFADFAKGQLSGQLQFIGDQHQQHLNGSVQLVRAKFEIPDEVASSQPLLVRKAREETPPEISSSTTGFDVEVDIPAKALIIGRGLNSYWRGGMHLGGNSQAPILEGLLELDTGNFTFCGRQFHIVESSIHLRKDRDNRATLHLVGEYPVEGATVRAILQGPLRSPKLSFESYPQLSLNEMLSRVLFGTSFNTISPFEALQVAHAAVFVSSGKSPVPLEQLRRNIQLDQISFQMPQEEEQGKYILQVGKYLRDGVLVGVKQGITSARESDVLVGTQVTLELKLKRHLTLKTEVGYLSESTVSLLWKKDY